MGKLVRQILATTAAVLMLALSPLGCGALAYTVPHPDTGFTMLAGDPDCSSDRCLHAQPDERGCCPQLVAEPPQAPRADGASGAGSQPDGAATPAATPSPSRSALTQRETWHPRSAFDGRECSSLVSLRVLLLI